MITGGQCRAGRAFLDWSQDALAEKAAVSRHTVRLFEAGGKTYNATVEQIEAALIKGGIKFILTEKGVGVFMAAHE